MQLQTGNLFTTDGERGKDEQIDRLVTGQRLNVERIVSMGHAAMAFGMTTRAPNGSCCCRAPPYSNSKKARRAMKCIPATTC